tara:strand:- start:224 stop:508 length:285 start_codon:yes stop_codon:yes gene_type:complete
MGNVIGSDSASNTQRVMEIFSFEFLFKEQNSNNNNTNNENTSNENSGNNNPYASRYNLNKKHSNFKNENRVLKYNIRGGYKKKRNSKKKRSYKK